jgi:hypothetical protein
MHFPLTFSVDAQSRAFCRRAAFASNISVRHKYGVESPLQENQLVACLNDQKVDVLEKRLLQLHAYSITTRLVQSR